MQINTRKALLMTTAFAVAVMLGAPANAAETKAPTAKLQEQITALQKQVDELKSEQAQTAAQAASADEKATKAANETEPGSLSEKLQAAVKKSTGVDVRLGGFFDMTGIYRTKNEGTDTGTNFNASIPYASSANAHQSEYRASARNTRISLLASGNPDKDTAIAGYFETDFAGTGTNSSSTELSNYTPRLRQAYLTYDRADTGWHLLGGQAWSLATQNSEGITPRKENVPVVLDSGLVPGFVYTREAQFRVVKDFNENKLHVGVSAEAPNSTSAVSAPNSNTSSNTNINGTGVTSTVDSVPDVVAKVAYDPGFGHYELFGIGRTFHDHSTVYGSNSTFAGSGGASVLFKTLEGKLDITANAIAGQSTGRYAPGQLPDYTVTPEGGIHAVASYAAMFGLVGHPNKSLDVFAYTGIEQIMKRPNYGYGESSNASCDVKDSGVCAAATKRLWQVTAGAWQSVYQGNFGKVAVGLQDSFTRKDAFRDTAEGYAPHAYENTSLLSFRYTPAY